MTYFENLKDVKTKVEELLTNNPKTRDSDNLLVATYYFYEAGGKDNLQQQSAFDFLKKMSNGSLTSFESISRARRKIQEQNPQLRGNNYKDRKETSEDVRQNIKNL
jgi:hypothetical protein